jgi:hypothetical protein
MLLFYSELKFDSHLDFPSKITYNNIKVNVVLYLSLLNL